MSERVICTAATPVKPSDRAQHPDAVEVDCICDCCAKYECPHCGQTFKVELPQ